MAKKSLSVNKVTGIVLLTIGVGLGIWGHQKSSGVQSQLSNALTGAHSDNVMFLYIGAAVAIVLGLYFLIKR